MTHAADAKQRATDGRIVLLIVCSATFMSFLDLSVVNVVFTTIGADFPDAPLTSLSWIVSGYAVMFAAFLAPAGRIADVLGRRTVFLASLAVFTAASAMCGATNEHEFLIAARLLQGVAAAGLIPSALGLLIENTEPARLGRAIAAWSATTGFSAVIGPVVGGLLVESSSWRAVFFINVPFGAAILVLAWVSLPRLAPSGGHGLPDLLGTISLVAGTAGLVAGVTEGSIWGWGDGKTSASIVGGLALTAFALFRSTRHSRPALHIDLWRNGRFATISAANAILGAAMFAWLLAGPIFLAVVWGWSVLDSALALTTGGLASMVGSIVAGRMKTPRSHAVVTLIAAMMWVACCFWMSTDQLSVDIRLWSAWVPAGILGGGALGLALTSLSTLAAQSVDPRKFAAGMGMNMASRQLGGAVGVALLATVLSSANTPLEGLHTVFLLCGVIGVAFLALATVQLVAVSKATQQR